MGVAGLVVGVVGFDGVVEGVVERLKSPVVDGVEGPESVANRVYCLLISFAY